MPRSFRRELDLVARRRGLAVGDVDDAVEAARERGVDRLRDVGDMDAVGDMARLVDAMSTARE